MGDFQRAMDYARDLLERGYSMDEAVEEAAATYGRTPEQVEEFEADLERDIEASMNIEADPDMDWWDMESGL